MRVAVDVVVGEQALVPRGIAGFCQSDNDDMDMRLAACVGTPCKGAVREGNFQPAPIEKDRPELRHLFALRNRSEEHTSELQSLMRISYAVFFLTKQLIT